MSRKHDRIHVFKMVFQIGYFDDLDLDETFLDYFNSFINADAEDDEEENAEAEKVDMDFVKKEFYGTRERLAEIDSILNENIAGWDTTRLQKTDLAILRLAVYEVLFNDDVPVGVAINEAVELAKAFSSDDSPPFINGILGKISETTAIKEKRMKKMRNENVILGTLQDENHD